MKPAPFSYHQPGSVAEAVDMLARHENSKVLAGGQSLMPMLNFRLAMPDHIIDVNRIPGLAGVALKEGRIMIGALTRHHDLEVSPLLAEHCPLFGETVPHIGHRQIQNRGTIGGSLSHCDPAAELPTLAVTLDATIHIAGPGGDRSVPMVEFALGYMTTCLALDELVTAVSFQPWAVTHGSSFIEFSRRHGDFAFAAIAALVELDEQFRFHRVAIALAGVAPIQCRLTKIEQALVGQPASYPAIKAAVDLDMEIEATGDLHASADYRLHLARVLSMQAVTTAVKRATKKMRNPHV